MTTNRHISRSVVSSAAAWLAIAVAGLPAPAAAQTGSPNRNNGGRQSASSTAQQPQHQGGLDRLWRMMERRGGRFVPTRNSRAVLSAFSDVVAVPSQSTVRVLSNGSQCALGTVVAENGYVLTKSSELKPPLTCQLPDGSIHAARIVNRDRGTDLAMLKIPADNLVPIIWEDTDSIAPGHWVATVGQGSLPLAIGVVSNRPRRVRGGMLGIIPVQGQQGPQIQHVMRDSGADRAGLLVGDTITRIDNNSVSSPSALIDHLATVPPGESVRVALLRSGQKLEVTVRLGDSRRGDEEQAKLSDKLAGALSERRVGFASVMKHDSVVQPNQCGGPLVDVDGRAVGINIAHATRVSSLALPADEVRAVLPKLMRETTTTVSQPTSNQSVLKPVLPK